MKYKNILATTQRFREIMMKFVEYGFADVLESEQLAKTREWLAARTGRTLPQSRGESTPARARKLLQALGPTFVKFGQMAASQSTTLPQAWLDELVKLQSEVPPFAYEEVARIIEEEFKLAPDEIFSSFRPEPLAAASIGQVHKAITSEGEMVAVKVQRPNIVPRIEEDLSIMHSLARTMESTTKAAREMGVVSSVDAFASSLMEELDYRHEGRNAERLGKNLANFEKIRSPKIHWAQSSGRVLTMEFVVGVKVTEVDALDAAGIDRKELCREFVRCVGQQILVDGFFHADPHPGNLSVDLERHELIFLDMGMMGVLDKIQRRDLVNLMLAVYARDSRALTSVVLELGTPLREVDKSQLTHEIERILGGLLDAPLKEIGAASFFTNLISMLQENGIRLPGELVLALKALMQMLEVVVALDPEMSFSDVAGIIAGRLAKQQVSPAAFQDFLQDRALRLKQAGPLVDDAIEELLRQVRSGSMTVELKGLDLSDEIKVVTAVARQLTIGLSLAGATIGSAIAMSQSPHESWSFVPVLGAIGFSVSIALIAALVLWEFRKVM